MGSRRLKGSDCCLGFRRACARQVADDRAGPHQVFKGGPQAEVLPPAFAGGDDRNLAAVVQGGMGDGAGIAQAAGQDGGRRCVCSGTLAPSGCRGKA